jgi:toxin ParE1/3/4
MAKLTFSSLAERDLDEILEYISRDKPGAAIKWVQRIRETCEWLAANPEIGQRRPEFKSGQVRSSLVGRYIVFYRPVSGGIEIPRIVRGERDIKSLNE